jgi:hypothetical protein
MIDVGILSLAATHLTFALPFREEWKTSTGLLSVMNKTDTVNSSTLYKQVEVYEKLRRETRSAQGRDPIL